MEPGGGVGSPGAQLDPATAVQSMAELAKGGREEANAILARILTCGSTAPDGQSAVPSLAAEGRMETQTTTAPRKPESYFQPC